MNRKYFYPTREMNARNCELEKEFKGKYFTHKIRKGLYKAIKAVYDQDSDSFKIQYQQVLVSNEFLSNIGEYKKLIPNPRAIYTRNPTAFRKKFTEVIDQEKAFSLAENIN